MGQAEELAAEHAERHGVAGEQGQPELLLGLPAEELADVLDAVRNREHVAGERPLLEAERLELGLRLDLGLLLRLGLRLRRLGLPIGLRLRLPILLLRRRSDGPALGRHGEV